MGTEANRARRSAWRRGVVFGIGVFSIAAPAVSADAPSSWFTWVLLLLGSAAGSLIATGLLDAVLDHLRRRWAWPKVWSRLRAVALTLITIGLTVLLGAGVATAVQLGRELARDCPAPVELPVVTDAEGLRTAAALADGFERSRVRRDCPGVATTVYAAGPADVQRALLAGWGGPEGYLQDVGPQPRVWLPASTVEVGRVLRAAAEQRGSLPSMHGSVYASTPLVLGAPAGHAPAAGATWLSAVQSLLDSGVGVIRPDAATSAIGQFAAAALYPAERVRSAGSLGWPRQLDQQMVAQARAARFPLTDGVELLRHHRQLGCAGAPTALVLTEQLVQRPDLADAALSAADQQCELIAVAPEQTLDLERPFVTIEWSAADRDPAVAMAEEFHRWVRSVPGQRAVRELALRPRVGAVHRLAAAGAATADGAPARWDDALLQRVEDAGRVQQQGHRPLRVLLAVDTSWSMRVHQQVTSVLVDDLVSRLAERDEVGVQTFGWDGARLALPIRPAGRSIDASAWRHRAPRAATVRFRYGQTSLWAGLESAVRQAADAGGAAERPATVVVLITDGRINAGPTQRLPVLNRAQAAGVRLLVLALDGSCDQRVLRELRNRKLGGDCWQWQGDSTAVDRLAAAAWALTGKAGHVGVE